LPTHLERGPNQEPTKMSDKVKIFAGRHSRELAERIASSYGVELGQIEIVEFSDGEFQASYQETVRGNVVFIVQSTPPPTENLFELLLMVDAAKRASAKRIIAVIPYYGFARQDRKDQPRVAIGAKLVANLLTAAGIDRIMTMDLHADQIQGFFEVPVDHLFGSTIFLPWIKENINTPDLVMAAPDTGGTKRANAYAKHLDVDLAICYKQRKKANEIANMTVIGDVSGKEVLLVDDMVDTAGTLTKAADLFMSQGAKSVTALCTHAVLSGPAYDRINQSVLTKLIVTDTLPIKDISDRIEVLSVDSLFADVMAKAISHDSISEHFVIA